MTSTRRRGHSLDLHLPSLGLNFPFGLSVSLKLNERDAGSMKINGNILCARKPIKTVSIFKVQEEQGR